MSDALTLDFSIVRKGQGLRISYTVHNRSSERVYLLDQMVSSSAGALVAVPDKIIVQGGEDGQVSFIRGYVDPGHPVTFQFAPGGRGLDPGKSLEGTAEVALPLAPWHPYGRLAPIKGNATSAVLQIGYVAGDVKWNKLPLKDGTTLSAPTLPSVVSGQRFVRSASKPIPVK